LGPFLTKDLLIYWRNRTEILTSLIMPLILIVVLGFTTSSWIEKSNESVQMTVAIVNEDHEAVDLAGLDLSDAGTQSPMQMLMQMFSNEQVKSFVKTVELDSVTADQQLHDKEIDAIIHIPPGFTQAALNKMLLNEGSGTVITLTANHRATLKIDVLQDMLDGFAQSLNLHTAIAHSLDSQKASLGEAEEISSLGGREAIEGVQMLTAFQYYSIAIGILFPLFIASATALRSIAEKREHVFQRILLTGSHPLRFLSGKVGATFCMSLCQLTILIVLTHFIFNLFPGRSLQFWLGMASIIVVFSLSVAALSALLTSLAFHVNDAAANGLFNLVLMIIGTIGGSFVPLYILPDWLKQVGEWTPNGLTLSVFIQWVQEDDLSHLTVPFLKLVIFSIGMIMVGSWLFPRRGRV